MELVKLQIDLESLPPSQFAAVAKRCLVRLDDFVQASEEHLRRVRTALAAIGDSLDCRISHGYASPCDDERADASLAISTFPERPVDSGLIQIAHSIKQSEGAAFSLIELLDFFPEMREPAKLDVQALRGGGDVNSLGDVWHGKKPDWNRMHAEVRQ
jgi:hypothetical protein